MKWGCKGIFKDLCKKKRGRWFCGHQVAVAAFHKEKATALHSSQHGPTCPTCLPGTGHSGHTMRHPLPAHFYCHSPPGQHEDGREIPGGDRDTSWHSPSQHFNPRRGAPVLSSAETLTDELQCLASKQNLGKLVELLRCPDCPS